MVPQVIEPDGPKCLACGRVCPSCAEKTRWQRIAEELQADPVYIKAYNAAIAGHLRRMTRRQLAHMLMRYMGRDLPQRPYEALSGSLRGDESDAEFDAAVEDIR